MKVFFDTSVLIPVFLGEDPNHNDSLAAYSAVTRKQGFCAAHSLAELYSAITRMPPPHRQGAEQAMSYVADIRDRLQIIALDENEYFQALSSLSSSGITGGTVYDGLLAQCALKAKVDIIYTWNVRHFQLLGPEIEKCLRTPQM